MKRERTENVWIPSDVVNVDSFCASDYLFLLGVYK